MVYQEKYTAPEESQSSEEQKQLENYANERAQLKSTVDTPDNHPILPQLKRNIQSFKDNMSLMNNEYVTKSGEFQEFLNPLVARENGEYEDMLSAIYIYRNQYQIEGHVDLELNKRRENIPNFDQTLSSTYKLIRNQTQYMLEEIGQTISYINAGEQEKTEANNKWQSWLDEKILGQKDANPNNPNDIANKQQQVEGRTQKAGQRAKKETADIEADLLPARLHLQKEVSFIDVFQENFNDMLTNNIVVKEFDVLPFELDVTLIKTYGTKNQAQINNAKNQLNREQYLPLSSNPVATE